MKAGMIIRIFCVSLVISLMSVPASFAQDNKEKEKIKKESDRLLQDAMAGIEDDSFTDAEVDLRKAIAILPEDERGKYNLGTAYYDKELNEEAMQRFKQAAQIAKNKKEKHKAFHNLGNTFMNAKKYQEAVDAYKNALRNNPTDDETRYNFALAKEMLEKNPPQGGDGEDDKNEQKDKDQEQQDQQNQDDQGNEKEGDDGEQKEDEDQGEQKDDNQEGDQQQDKQQPKEPKDGDKEEQKKQQPVPGKLSPQQVQNLLEAMNNEEKKVQDKINARKQKGAKVKSNKDW